MAACSHVGRRMVGRRFFIFLFLFGHRLPVQVFRAAGGRARAGKYERHVRLAALTLRTIDPNAQPPPIIYLRKTVHLGHGA